MARNTLLALLVAVNLLEGALVARAVGGTALAPPAVVIFWAPGVSVPEILPAAARRVGLASGAEWHNASRLLCQVLERYGAIGASGSVDDIARGLLAEAEGGRRTLDAAGQGRVVRLLREARAKRDQVRENQEKAVALESDLGRIADRVSRQGLPGGRGPEGFRGGAEGDEWRRLQERLEGRP